MKVEYINPFLTGTQKTLSGLCGYEGKLGKAFMKTGPYKPSDVAVIIGFSGDLKGEVVYSMSEECGIYLASKFMVGFDVNQMCEMAQSSIMELANMISGNAANALFSLELKVNITPPTYIRGSSGLEFVSPDSKFICMPIQIEGERVFEVDLHFA
ncbi:MAG: chemotaxis protein CheX [Defluviitaleaceae bacterium]|nr:chemotaxis protein CheX [Defluviitaleaceae bacterium]